MIVQIVAGCVAAASALIVFWLAFSVTQNADLPESRVAAFLVAIVLLAAAVAALGAVCA